MAANEIRLMPASEDDFMTTQTQEHDIQERIKHLQREVDSLNQLLGDRRRRVVSPSRHRSQAEATMTHQVPASTSGLTASGETSTSVSQSGAHYIYAEDSTELPSTPRTAFFPSFPMSPLTVNDGSDRGHDVLELYHSRAHSFHLSGDRSSPAVARPRSASEAAHGPRSFLGPQRTSTTSILSHRARASTSTLLTSPRDNGRWMTQEAQLQYESLIEVRNHHWFNRACQFNRMNACTPLPGEPYTRELIPWPTEMDSLQFLHILEPALQPHALDCDKLHYPPTDCQTCIARINVQGVVTEFLRKTMCTGESILSAHDQWYPNDDWLTIGVKRRDQHFVRLDPKVWRMSMPQAAATHARRHEWNQAPPSAFQYAAP